MRSFNLAFAVLLSFIVAGCATPIKSGLTKTTEKIELNNESLLILTAELSNEYKTRFQPVAFGLFLETQDAGHGSNLYIPVDKESVVPDTAKNTYVFRGLVKPGKYMVRGINGMSSHFPVSASFFVPLHCEIAIEPGKIIDLGKVVATVRERTGNEFKAGPSIPLLDQAMAGFSGGTFDVQISAQSAEEIQRLKSIFPALRGTTIVAQTLPPFDRAKAQQWWEMH